MSEDNRPTPIEPFTTPGNRLKGARIAAGYSSGTFFADAKGFDDELYLAHEAGDQDLDDFAAQNYSDVFVKDGHPDITPAWLMWGEPSMSEPDPHSVAGHALLTAAQTAYDGIGRGPGGTGGLTGDNVTTMPQRLEIEVLEQGYLITVGGPDGIDDDRRWACRDAVDMCATLVEILNPVVPALGSMLRAESVAVTPRPKPKEDKP